MVNREIVNGLVQLFASKYNATPQIFRSPGRVNIIGEHTDYNDGFVLPAAIDKAMYVAAAATSGDIIELYSPAYNDTLQMPLSAVQKSEKAWANYVLGVVHEMQLRGHKLGGFQMVLDGDVPIGAGLSSSAALECAAGLALNHLFRLGIPDSELILIAQKAEHTYAGVRSGIMDQFASVYGKKDHCIKLDCRSMEYEYMQLKLEGYKIVLLNTNVEHSLASSEYNVRRQQCESGVAAIQKKHPQVKSLRDVTIPMLTEAAHLLDPVTFKRCRYVVEENERLLAACEDLKAGDVAALGQKMFRTHEGLSKEYEVSCKELDFLVDAVRSNTAVLGARMMGGGFGGCTINLVATNAVDELVQTVSQQYQQHLNKQLTAYVAQIGDGSSIVKL